MRARAVNSQISCRATSTGGSMNFSRKTILVVGAALLAACGDKVTVQEYTPPATTAKVNFVEVTPATATVNTGASITFTAAVNADAGLATTVTWTASAGTITTAGVFTAPATANPGIAVCATSTVDTGKKGCATVVVSPPITQVPATVSIQSITGAGGLNIPVNPAAVAGQIDVTLNINPGNQTISKVEVLFGTIVAYTQTFTAAQAAALRFAADEAIAAQTTFPQVVASINTACYEGLNATCNAYKTTDATGDAVWTNGATALQAKIYTTASGTSQAASASVSQNLTLANVNAFATTVTAVGTTNGVNNALGFRYTRGDLKVDITPVSYTGAVASTLNVTFGAPACDGAGGNPQRALALTKTGNTFSGTLTNTAGGAAGAGNLNAYSFNCAALAVNATGEQFTIASVMDANGSPFTTAALGAVGPGFRMDNLAPTVPGLNFTIASLRNNANWVNDAAKFNDVAASGGAIAVVSTEVALSGGVGLSATPANVYQVTVGGNIVTSAAGLAESIANTTYSATAKAQDLLGNLSAASGAVTFGVDRTVPTFTHALPADASVIAAPGGVAFGAFTYSDPATLPAGPSTPTATPIRVTVRKWTSATSSAYSTGAAWGAAGGAATPFNIGLAAGPFIDAAGTNSQGYYVVTAFAEDGAANPSASVTRTYLYDVTAPAGPFTIPVMTTSAGQSNLFTSTMTDNVDLLSSQWQMEYAVLAAAPGAAGAALRLPTTTFGSFQSWTITGSSSANYPLYRSMINGAFVAGAGQGLLTVGHQVVDRGTNVAPFAATAIPAVNLPAPAAADPYPVATYVGFTYAGFVVPNIATVIDIDGATIAVGNSATATVNATLTGPPNTTLNPFTRVEFWIYNAAANAYQQIGTATAPTVVDNAVNRVYTWTISWNPDAAGQYNNPNAAGVQNIIAIGVNTTNDAVRTAAGTVTTTP